MDSEIQSNGGAQEAGGSSLHEVLGVRRFPNVYSALDDLRRSQNPAHQSEAQIATDILWGKRPGIEEKYDALLLKIDRSYSKLADKRDHWRKVAEESPLARTRQFAKAKVAALNILLTDLQWMRARNRDLIQMGFAGKCEAENDVTDQAKAGATIISAQPQAPNLPRRSHCTDASTPNACVSHPGLTTERQMAEVRKEGLEKHLLDKAGGALWEAKRHLEDASKERFINFEREITAARKQIDDAEQLWRETYKL